jgi:hypothetical protein
MGKNTFTRGEYRDAIDCLVFGFLIFVGPPVMGLWFMGLGAILVISETLMIWYIKREVNRSFGDDES